jgi:hypothetical protein
MNDTSDASKSWLIPATPPPGFQHAHPKMRSVPGSPVPPHGRPTRQRQRSRSFEDRLPTPGQLRVDRWVDPLVTNAVPANGFYTERYYGPIVGPTCLLLLRTLAGQLETDRDGFTVETAELAASIGCSAKAGPNSQFWKALRRGIRFGLLRQIEERVLVRTEISPLTARMVQRLPLNRRHEHRVWTTAPDPTQATTHSAERSEPVSAIELLRLAARGLCTSEELRTLDRAHKLT